MVVNPDVLDVYTPAEKTKTPRKTQKNNHLLKIKKILNIKMSAKGDPVFTFSLTGGGSPHTSPSVTPFSSHRTFRETSSIVQKAHLYSRLQKWTTSSKPEPAKCEDRYRTSVLLYLPINLVNGQWKASWYHCNEPLNETEPCISSYSKYLTCVEKIDFRGKIISELACGEIRIFQSGRAANLLPGLSPCIRSWRPM